MISTTCTQSVLTSLEWKCKTLKKSNKWTTTSKEDVDSKYMALLSITASKEEKLQGLLQHMLTACNEESLKTALTAFLL